MDCFVSAFTPWSRGGDGELPARVVILRWQERAQEWSTHIQIRDGRDFPTFIWGHYFSTWEEAFDDVERRVRMNNTGMTPEHENYIPRVFPSEMM